MKYLLGAALAGLYFIIATLLFGHVSPVMIFLGLPCPACGLTRAGMLLLTGRFADSFRMHPLFVPTFAFIVWAAVEKVFRPHRLKRLQNPALVLLVSAFGVYIFRMVHMFPHYPPMVVNRDAILMNIIFLIWERI